MVDTFLLKTYNNYLFNYLFILKTQIDLEWQILIILNSVVYLIKTQYLQNNRLNLVIRLKMTVPQLLQNMHSK